ncbi:MAG: FAD-binding protein [Candidatus Aminicenantales bacterium]
MIIDSPLEVKLYMKETIEVPEFITGFLPGVKEVIQPENEDDVEKIFSYSKKNNLSVIPRGAATSGTGSLIPLRKSLMVDTTSLNRILDIESKKRTVLLEAGTRWWELKKTLADFGLDLYTCPTSLFSTVGGWLATGGYGLNSLKYGHVANSVISIEVVTPSGKKLLLRHDPGFKYFMGSEGQMGIITRIKLALREKKPLKPYLLFFNSVREAENFIGELVRLKIAPLTALFLDRYRLKEKGYLLKGGLSFPEMEGVFVVFDKSESLEKELLNLTEKRGGFPAEDYLTSFLWNERYFPFSVKKRYPSLLGCETILPVEKLSSYIARAREFAASYGLSLSSEASLINRKEAVVFTLFPSASRGLTHLLHLFLTYSLARIAVKSGGVPYNIGLWNLPLLEKKYSPPALAEYSRFKKSVDPHNLMNTSKSFSPTHPTGRLLKFTYRMSGLFPEKSSFFRKIGIFASSNGKNNHRPLSEPEACSSCGACTAACPAYLMKRNEIITAKGKLFLIKHFKKGSFLPPETARKIFFCLHCHLCELVCQSKLSLMSLWERLESRVEKKYGKPKEEEIEAFVKEVESNPRCKELFTAFSLSIPKNTNGKKNV